MKRFSAQFKKQSDRIQMSAAERRDVRERLVAYMEYHPLPAELKSQLPEGRLAAEPYRLVRLDVTYLKVLAGLAAVFILVVVPVAAEHTLPGDVLYPVKVNVNEEVRSSLAFSPYEKVEWETERLERRLAEARLLADEGRLTEEVKAEVAAAVKEHSASAQKEIAAIRATDSDAAAIAGLALSTALEVQSEVLENDLAENGAATSTMAALANALEAARTLVAAEQNAASYDRLLERLKSESTRAQDYLNALSGTMSEDEVSNINRRLDDISRKMTEAAELQAAPDPANAADARKLLTQALTDTSKLISFITDIDVKENVAIDELVPITLTEAERRQLITERLAEIEAREHNVGEILKSSSDEERASKVRFGLDTVTRLTSQANASLERDRLSAAESAIAEALEILYDLQFMLSQSATTAATSTEPNASTTESETDTSTTTATTTEATSTDDGTASTSPDLSTTTESEG